MKNIIGLFAIMIPLTISCKKENPGFDPGGPVTGYLMGSWQLEKVVSPSGTKTGTQIKYSEIVEIGNDNVEDFEKTFRNGSLVVTYTRLRTPPPISNAKDLTMTIFYFGGKKRYYKVRQDPSKTTLEASDYLTEIGSPQDTVRYFYSRIE